MGAVWFSVLFSSLFMSGVVLDTCKDHTNCRGCITNPAVCVWCAADNFNSTRCMSSTDTPEGWCPTLLQNPSNKKTITDNSDFNSDRGKVIQIKPQKYEMHLRPGVPMDFTFSYQPASDYPVDLYFLLDTSLTMRGVKDVIEEQSKHIYDTMRNLTSNVQLGIGAFIDKNTFPFTDKIDSEKTYSFRNRLKLTNDLDLFKKVINETEFGYNSDEPEGGLDALAQVITCKDVIGWRDESRKLIIFLTDATYHVAGDGIIGGIYKPYDGKCYTNEKGDYTKELEMDYPSVSIIRKLAADEEITIIFAVKTTLITLYSHLSQAISGSKHVSYEGGNNKIANILTDVYKDITREIKLKVNFKPGFRNKFSIKFDPNCTINDNPDCGVREGEEKVITGTLTVLEDHESDSTPVDIIIEGIKEKLTLDVHFIKGCECESKAKHNAPECNSGGTFKCGSCECNTDRYGDKCACIVNSMSAVNDNSTCIMPGEVDLCHGHGSCICGRCVCTINSPYEGNFCQFNKDNCPRHNNTVCNGHGECKNERCVCDASGWHGDACECPKQDQTCIGSNGKVCNNMGSCDCGRCICNSTADWDARDNQDMFCNVLPCRDCHKPQCDRLNSCAVCVHSRQECPDCKPFKASITEYRVSPANTSWKICPDIAVEVGCYTQFMYRYSEDEYLIELMVQADKNCLQSYYMFGGMFLFSLILVGLLTLLGWKLLTDARDRREYERFKKEYDEGSSHVCDNPTYRPASTTINNPAFRKPSVDYRN